MNGDRNGFAVNNRWTSITRASTVGALLISVFYVLGLLGCTGSEKSNFYMLGSMDQFSATISNTDSVDISIGIGPLTIPEYLNRPQIVTRSGRYEIDIAEFDRWAESLEDAIPGVIAENLSSLLSTDRVYTYPWPIKAPAYDLKIEIIRFDGTLPGSVELTARWTLSKGGMETRIHRKKFIDKKPIAGQGYSGMVSAMSLVLYDMSREIADSIIRDIKGDSLGNTM